MSKNGKTKVLVLESDFTGTVAIWAIVLKKCWSKTKQYLSMWSVHMYHLCLDTYEANKQGVASMVANEKRHAD